MSEERPFLDAIAANREDDAHRAAYASWLTAHEDERGPFLRLELQLRNMDPDLVQRPALEQHYSRQRRGFSADWLDAIKRPPLSAWKDDCFKSGSPFPRLHADIQDTECDSWKQLQDLIEDAAADRRAELSIFHLVKDRDERGYLVTLPSSIAKLSSLRKLEVGATEISRIPPEIGEMSNLSNLDAYMAGRLHWYPYEMTRCSRLKNSMMSTRVLYGNYKYRYPFPSLAPAEHVDAVGTSATRACSVCDRPFIDRRAHRVWLSRRLVSADVPPLLVNACSEECIQRLPAPTPGYVPHPHRGGPDVVQPTGWPPAPTLAEVRASGVFAPIVLMTGAELLGLPEHHDERANKKEDDDESN